MGDAGRGEGGERVLISRFLKPLTAGAPPHLQSLNLRDDCALLTPVAGRDLVVTSDGLIEGVHFFADEHPELVGWKALAVNVSDLICKGAAPMAYMLNLALNDRCDDAWLARFCDGLSRAQASFGCYLVGGDTDKTPGPISLYITAIGEVETGQMVKCAGACAGDLIYTSGTIGDAHLGLRLRQDQRAAGNWELTENEQNELLAAYMQPRPWVGVSDIVRAYASAATDVSDGLIKDAAKLCACANLQATLRLGDIPLSDGAARIVRGGRVGLVDLATGGEDYEVLATISASDAAAFEAAARDVGVRMTCVGEMGSEQGELIVTGVDGERVEVPRMGWDHF